MEESQNLQDIVDIPAIHQLLTDSRFNQIAQDATSKELVLFFGLKGAGKSSCINYLLGVKLDPCKNYGGSKGAKIALDQEKPLPSHLPPIATNLTTTFTPYSQIYQDPCLKDIAYCDSAGFLSERESHEEIGSALSLQLAVNSSACVKAIFIVIEWVVFELPTSKAMETLMYTLSQICNRPEEESASIFFLFNKVANDIDKEDCSAAVSQYKDRLSLQLSLFDHSDKTEDISEYEFTELSALFHWITFLDNQIQNKPENIILMDIFDSGLTRQLIHTRLQSQTTIVNKKNLNFREYNQDRKNFDENIDDILPLVEAYSQKNTLAAQASEKNRSIETIDIKLLKELTIWSNQTQNDLLKDNQTEVNRVDQLQKTQRESLQPSQINSNPINIILKAATIFLGLIAAFFFIVSLGGAVHWEWTEHALKALFQTQVTTAVFISMSASLLSIIFCVSLIIHRDRLDARYINSFEDIKPVTHYGTILPSSSFTHFHQEVTSLTKSKEATHFEVEPAKKYIEIH